MAKIPPTPRPLARRVVDLALRCAQRRPLNDGPMPGVFGLRLPGDDEPFLLSAFSSTDGPMALAVSGPGGRVDDLRARLFAASQATGDARNGDHHPPVAADLTFVMVEPPRRVSEPFREVFRASGRGGREVAYFVGCAAGQSELDVVPKARLRRIAEVLEALVSIAAERSVPTGELTERGPVRVPTIRFDADGRPGDAVTEIFDASGCRGAFDRRAALAALPRVGDALHLGVGTIEIAPGQMMEAIALVRPDDGDLVDMRFAAFGDIAAIADAVTDCFLDGAVDRPVGLPASLTVETEPQADALRERCGEVVAIAVAAPSAAAAGHVEHFRRRLRGEPGDTASPYRSAAERLAQRALQIEGSDGAFGFQGRREFFGIGQMPDHPMAAPAQLEWVLMHRLSSDGRRLVDRMLSEELVPPLDDDVRALLEARLDATPTVWEVRAVADGALHLVDRCADGVSAVVPFEDAAIASHMAPGSWLIGRVVTALDTTQFLALGPLIRGADVPEVRARLAADGFDWTHAGVAARPERFGRLFVPQRLT